MQDRAARPARMPQLAKYELLEELGHGGMATVYRARDRRLGREVAVKVIHPHLRNSREVVSRFNAEAKAVAKLRHPNIVDVYDVSEPEEPDQYLVAGLVRGTTLRKLLHERGPMPPEIGAALGCELLAALAHAHAKGVVHRDVKPENVLIERSRAKLEVGADTAVHERDDSWVIVKLTDFGIAKLLDVQGVTSTGQVLGSPAHMSPEQIEGGDVDARSDVFGVGVLLYECMVGRLPFDGGNPAQVLRRVLDGVYPEAQHERPVVGSRWSKLLDRALSHSPGDRFLDANAMRDAIVAELHRLDIQSPERDLETWLDDPAEFEDRHRKTLIAKLCALASDARKRGDVLAAAADYNRALAYAPGDPQLLRIVAGMNRAERRGRILRRLGVASAVALALGALVLGAEAFLRGRVVAPTAGPTVAVDPVPSPAATSAMPIVLASIAPSPVASRPPAPTAIPRDAVQRVADRKLTLDLKPPMGVSVSIDGQPERGVSTGDVLTLATKAHVLGFSCPVCTPVRVTVDASERDATLAVYVPVKPATLVVDGDGARTYQIVEHPEIAVRAGANTVPLRSEYEPVTVKQIETGDSVSVRLEAAKTMRAAFP